MQRSAASARRSRASRIPVRPRLRSPSRPRSPRRHRRAEPAAEIDPGEPAVAQGFSGAGVLYAIHDNGDLLWYHHDGHNDGTFRWARELGTKIGVGWIFKQVFSGGDGAIYAINQENELLWYRHLGLHYGNDQWAEGQARKVGEGWTFKKVFPGGGGVIYAIADNGDLLWFRHDGWADGTFEWAAFEGKNASNRVTVRARDVTKVANVIDVLVGAGANDIGGINFIGNARPQNIWTKPATKAIADARRKAEIYAKAAGRDARRAHQHFRGRRTPAPVFPRQDGSADGRRRTGGARRRGAFGDGERVLGDQGGAVAACRPCETLPGTHTAGLSQGLLSASMLRERAHLRALYGSRQRGERRIYPVLPRLQRREPPGRTVASSAPSPSAIHRRVDRLVGQLERAVMMRERHARPRNRPAPSPRPTEFMCWSFMNQRGS